MTDNLRGHATHIARVLAEAFAHDGVAGITAEATIQLVMDALDDVVLEAKLSVTRHTVPKTLEPGTPAYVMSLVQRGSDLVRELMGEGLNDAERMAVLAYAEATTRTMWGAQQRVASQRKETPR